MKKTKEELMQSYSSKIAYLRLQLNAGRELDLRSELRDEYANNIAVTLRTLLCYVSGTESLCKRCDLQDKLFFSLHSGLSAVNILPTYELVDIKYCNDYATFVSSAEPLPQGCLYHHYLTYSSWLQEIVIDFKKEGYEPLSRKDVIRIVADRMGAHVDSEYDPNLYLIAKENILPIIIQTEKGEAKSFGRNLFTETILSITEELLIADSCLGRLQFKQIKKSELKLYIQKYEKGYKYVLFPEKINPDNSNPFYECTIFEAAPQEQTIIYQGKQFRITLIDVDRKRKALSQYQAAPYGK